MKLISLTQGFFAQVDDHWFEELNQYKWYANESKNTYYACRNGSHAGGKREKRIQMHRVIMSTPEGLVVDHIDRDGLNCLEENMRNCTTKENSRNSTPHGRSQYMGVFFETKNLKGQTYIYIKSHIFKDGVGFNLGSFKTEEEAARAYDKKAKELFGGFANLNFK